MNQSIELEEIRAALQREFITRCKKNPAYSLRAFALYLDIHQSFLSKILKGQRRVTPAMAEKLAPKLGLHKVKSSKSKGGAGLKGSLPLAEDEINLLSSWVHFALIENAKTKGFNPDPRHIARRLGLHVEEVREAQTRLERLGFIKIQKDGWRILSPNTSWTNSQKTTEARRQFQKSLIEKSLDAIDQVPFELRENGSITVAINKKRLTEFKTKLTQIREELADFLQTDNETDLDEVYQMTFALFPLSKIKELEQ